MLFTIDSYIQAHTLLCEKRIRNALKMAHTGLHGHFFANICSQAATCSCAHYTPVSCTAAADTTVTYMLDYHAFMCLSWYQC